MAISLPSPDTAEEYIDMELGSLFLLGSSSQRQREFEFQLSTASLWREATTSSADELFYKGKLLPLQHPMRIEMVEKLLEGSVSTYEESCSTPLIATAPTSPTASTLFESCNVSPCESCCISRELNPDVYFCEFLVDLDIVKPMGDNRKNSWLRNIKLIKQRFFIPKLKGSRSFFKTLLGKSGCSDDSSAAATMGIVSASPGKRDGSLYRRGNQQKGDGSQRAQLNKGRVKSSPEENAIGDRISFRQHRSPLPLSSKWLKSNKISSSSFSSSSSSSAASSKEQDHGNKSEFQNSSRRTHVNSESAIQAAIAYCKQSQNAPQEPKKQPDICRG